MAKICMECGELSNLNIFNYAGVDVKKDGKHAFPQRVVSLTLPGNKKNEFLCADCANKRTVECTFHRKLSLSKFERGNIPTCSQCEKQLKAILNKELPPGFKAVLFPVKINRKGQKGVSDCIVATSNDGYVHFIDGQVRASTHEQEISSSVSQINSSSLLTFSVEHNTIESCEIDLNDTQLFQQSKGPWIDLWKKDINNKLNLPDSFVKGYRSIVEIESLNISTKRKGTITKESGKFILAFYDDKFITFPKLDLQPFDDLTAWHTDSYYPDKSLELKYEQDEAIQVLKLFQKHIFDGLNRIEDLKKYLPSEKINDNPGNYDLSQIEFADAFIYPSRKKITYRVEVKDTGLLFNQLDGKTELRSTTGVYYKNYWLINADNKESFTIRLSETDQSAHDIIHQPKELLKIGEEQYFGTFFDKKDSSQIHTIYLGKDSLVVDDQDNIPYSNIEDINVSSLKNNVSQLKIKYKSGMDTNTLKVVSADPLCFHTWETIESSKTKSETSLMTTNQLYEQFGKTKKNILLSYLFGDIVLLNSNINKDILPNDLSKKLSSMSDEAFFKNKNLRELTTQKMLLLSIFIPKIKQNFEKLYSWFPYRRFEYEISYLEDVFGKEVAKNMLYSERRRIRELTRNNIVKIQSDIFRKLNQIQQELNPLEAKFAMEEIQKTISSKIAKNTPLIGQLVVAGALFVSSSTLGPFGAFLGIKVLGDILGYYAKDRESAFQLKRVAEKVLSWWNIFYDTLPVIIFEAGEAIDDENIRSMERDMDILSKYKLNDKNNVECGMQMKLRKEIGKGRNIRFKEILEGSGIRYNTIETDIKNYTQIEMKKNYHSFKKLLPNITD